MALWDYYITDGINLEQVECGINLARQMALQCEQLDI